MPRIVSLATAIPEHRFTQSEILERSRRLFGPLLKKPGREAIFERAGVQTRYLAEPAEYYMNGPSFEDNNRNYFRHALALSKECLLRCLERASTDCSAVDHILSVTTTGLLTPSLESHLAQALPFSRSVKRTPLFGVGCAGGVVALARAGEHLKGHPGETVLALSTELCSLTFLSKKRTMTELVATAIFGDGAAAALLAGDDAPAEGGVAELVASHSHLLPDSLDLMGWDFVNEGMRLVLSAKVPRMIEAHLAAAASPLLKKAGLERKDVGYWILHPGSLRVLEAMARALELEERDLRFSKAFLQKYGNLSSASVFFVLEELLKAERPRPGSYGVMAAMGPGFAAELLLLRFL